MFLAVIQIFENCSGLSTVGTKRSLGHAQDFLICYYLIYFKNTFHGVS